MLSDNSLLAALPPTDIHLLKDQFDVVSLQRGAKLFQSGSEVREVYFPVDGVVSLVSVMQTGRKIETAAVGKEGAVGAMAGLGPHISHVQAVVQRELTALTISDLKFRARVRQSRSLAELCFRYNEVLLDQARIIASCNAMHRIENRLPRWLLLASDRAGGTPLSSTQEFMSDMLGVRRSSVSEVAMKLQESGIIRYVRGKIIITDRGRLQAAACECYETLRERVPI